ncbi:signal peptidase I [Candidatus Uabimicrobium sp. HlEnr_7]|uniref:signal peptidase I n=1 Tax=Candidatus Uabimicrobium helgolandensis TaxID=3095367 RepID=UPI0035575488
MTKQTSQWKRKLFRMVERVFAIIGFIFFLYFLLFDLSIISSYSMSPTLQGTNRNNGDWVLTEKWTYWFRNPKRWEIVTFQNKDGIQVMKRVAGLSGETISIDPKKLWVLIDEVPLSRPPHLDFLKYYAFGSLYIGRKVTIKDGYFVLGDHSRDSYDSRFSGVLRRRNIIGRAWFIVWPWNRIGFVR